MSETPSSQLPPEFSPLNDGTIIDAEIVGKDLEPYDPDLILDADIVGETPYVHTPAPAEQPSAAPANARAIEAAPSTPEEAEQEPEPRLRPTPVLDRPYERARSPRATAEEIADFDTLLTAIISKADLRFNMSSKERVDKGAKGQVYWEGNDDMPSMRDTLARQMAKALNDHPELASRVEARLSLHREHTNGAVTTRAARVNSHTEANNKVADAANDAKRVETVKEFSDASPYKPEEGTVYRTPDPADYKRAHIRGYGGFKYGTIEKRIPKGVREFFDIRPGAAHREDTRTFYEDVANPIVSKEVVAADTRLLASRAGALALRSSEQLTWAEMRVDSLEDVLSRAEEMINEPVAELVGQWNTPDAYHDHLYANLGSTARTFMETSDQDEDVRNNTFLGLDQLHSYIDAIDQTITSGNLGNRSHERVVALRTEAMSVYLGARYRYEQMDLMTGRGDATYRSDKAIIPADGSEVRLYPDSSYTIPKPDAFINDRRDAEGSAWIPSEAAARELRVILPDPAKFESMSDDEIYDEYTNRFETWFIDQGSQSSEAARITVTAIGNRMDDRIQEDLDDMDAGETLDHDEVLTHRRLANYYTYWEKYFSIKPGSETHEHEAQIGPEGAITTTDQSFVSEAEGWANGEWTVYPIGSKILVQVDGRGRSVIRRFDSYNEELVAA